MKMEHTELHRTVIKEIYSTLKRNALKSIQPQSQERYEKQKHRASIGRVRTRAEIKNKQTLKQENSGSFLLALWKN